MKKISKTYYVILCLAFFTGCNEALSPDPSGLGYDYFPLHTGDTRIYDVIRIDHTVDRTSDTTRYQMMEVVGEQFFTGGEESFRIERYTRTAPTDEWEIEAVWSARLNTYQAIVVENNVPIIKLSFPLEENRRWDGNAMNAREYDEFKMVGLGEAYQVGDLVFVSTLEMVKEEALDPSQTVSDAYHKEFFAKGVGMIYRVDIDRTYCTDQPCPPSKVAFGLEMEYKLIEYQLGE